MHYLAPSKLLRLQYEINLMSDFLLNLILNSKPISIETDPTVRLPYPHYTDRRFEEETIIWQSSTYDPTSVCSHVYDDRLRTQDWGKHNQVIESLKSLPTREIANWHIAYVQGYFNGKYDLKQILACYDHSSGFPIYIYGLSDKNLS
jgi:hypothetical protein